MLNDFSPVWLFGSLLWCTFKTIVEMFHDLLATAAGMNSEINLQRCH